MILAAIDPSFTRTGMVLLDTTAKQIIFKNAQPPGTNDTYNNMVARSAIITQSVLELVKPYNNVTLIYEEPLLVSLKASTLGVLSGVLAVSVSAFKSVQDVYTIRPSAITQINSGLASKDKKTSKKQISLKVIRALVEYLEKELNYTVEYRTDKVNKDGSPKARLLTHDEAEAAYLLLILLKHIHEQDDDFKYIISKSYEINAGFRKAVPINKLYK